MKLFSELLGSQMWREIWDPTRHQQQERWKILDYLAPKNMEWINGLIHRRDRLALLVTKEHSGFSFSVTSAVNSVIHDRFGYFSPKGSGFFNALKFGSWLTICSVRVGPRRTEIMAANDVGFKSRANNTWSVYFNMDIDWQSVQCIKLQLTVPSLMDADMTQIWRRSTQ